jgi:hypothetical protein
MNTQADSPGRENKPPSPLCVACGNAMAFIVTIADPLVKRVRLFECPKCRNCVIRSKPAADSDANRPPIPTEAGHPFRSKPATLLRVVEALLPATESLDETPFAAMQGEVRCPPRERRCGRFEKF